VLDRPNPMGGLIIDGPMLQADKRSFLGYINVPYCHGMTIGELASFFNDEYKVKCKLKVIGLKGWKREMTYQETGLVWTPTSPQIPEADTPFFYPATGLLGELQLVSIGIGYTLRLKWLELHGSMPKNLLWFSMSKNSKGSNFCRSTSNLFSGRITKKSVMVLGS